MAKELSRYNFDIEAILVVDGFVDKTYDIAKKFEKKYKWLKVVGYKENKGKGYAIKYGLRYCGGGIVGYLDADLDIPLSKFMEAVKTLIDSNADIVIASKYVKGARLRYPLLRRLLSMFYRINVYLLFPFMIGITDTQVGCKVFKRKVAEFLFEKVKSNRFAFDLELLILARFFRFNIKEIPVHIEFKNNSTISSSLISLAKTVLRTWLELITIAYWLYIKREYFN